MTAAASLGLWLACAIFVAAGLSARRSSAPARSSPRSGRLPWALRAALGVPVPRRLVDRMVRPGDEQEIARAGLTDDVSTIALARMRSGLALSGLAGAGVMALAAPAAVATAPLLAGLGAAAPGRWLAHRKKDRRRALVREMPDLLDLLAICVEAGMALDPALGLTVERLGGTLGQEMEAVLRDLSLGTPRRVAYRALVERAGTPELTRTVGALLQAEELGAPLSTALHGQSEAMRAARRVDARERAARAAPKIQLIVAMLMVPAVLLLVMGVLVIELSRQVGAVIG